MSYILSIFCAAILVFAAIVAFDISAETARENAVSACTIKKIDQGGLNLKAQETIYAHCMADKGFTH